MKVNKKQKQVFEVDGKQFDSFEQAQQYRINNQQSEQHKQYSPIIQSFVQRLEQLNRTGHQLRCGSKILGEFYVDQQIYFGQPYRNEDESECQPSQQFFSCDGFNVTQKDYDLFLKFKAKVTAYRITKTKVEI